MAAVGVLENEVRLSLNEAGLIDGDNSRMLGKSPQREPFGVVSRAKYTPRLRLPPSTVRPSEIRLKRGCLGSLAVIGQSHW